VLKKALQNRRRADSHVPSAKVHELRTRKSVIENRVTGKNLAGVISQNKMGTEHSIRPSAGQTSTRGDNKAQFPPIQGEPWRAPTVPFLARVYKHAGGRLQGHPFNEY
jgi:hypothetical protein